MKIVLSTEWVKENQWAQNRNLYSVLAEENSILTARSNIGLRVWTPPQNHNMLISSCLNDAVLYDCIIIL